MIKRKTDSYVVTDLKQPLKEAPWLPPIFAAQKGQSGRVLYLDKDVAPSAFYLECDWITQPSPIDPSGKNISVQPHRHNYDEVIGFFGTNYADIHDLGGEVELWLEDEMHILTGSCMVYVPAGVQHCPLIFQKVSRPIFHLISGPGTKTYL